MPGYLREIHEHRGEIVTVLANETHLIYKKLNFPVFIAL